MPNFHIKRAKLDGYRNIRGTEAEFCDGLNIIIGPNGCGKSNFLWLLANISDHSKMLIDMKGEIEVIEDDGKSLITKIHHEYVQDKQIVKPVLIKKIIEAKNKNKLQEVSTSLVLSNNILLPFNVPNEIPTFSNSYTLIIKKIHHYLFAEIDNEIIKRFILDKANDYYDKEDKPQNSYTLDYFNFSEDILKKVATYTPVNNIRIKYPMSSDRDFEDNTREIKIRSLLYEFEIGNEWFEWNELSDGTRRIVWLVLNILTTEAFFILIEEPELGIHPHQLNLLMLFIKEQSEKKQFIITTHSPEVLNIISTDELDRIKIAKYDAVNKTTIIHAIPEKTQIAIQEYATTQGFLSDYWVHLDLENTAEWK